MNAEERRQALASFKQHPVWEFLSTIIATTRDDAVQALCIIDPCEDPALIARTQGTVSTCDAIVSLLDTYADTYQEEETL